LHDLNHVAVRAHIHDNLVVFARGAAVRNERLDVELSAVPLARHERVVFDHAAFERRKVCLAALDTMG